MKKHLAILLLLMPFSLLTAQTQTGYFKTEKDFLADKLIPMDKFVAATTGAFGKGGVKFEHKGQTVKLNADQIYAFQDDEGVTYRFFKETIPVKMFIRDAICLYGDLSATFELNSDGTVSTSASQFFISDEDTGEIVVMNKKRLRDLLYDEPEALAYYEEKRNALEAIIFYNSKHETEKEHLGNKKNKVYRK